MKATQSDLMFFKRKMDKNQLIKKNKFGKGTKIWDYVNLYGCTTGENCIIGAFVEIQQGVLIGDRVKVESHSFICEGVIVENDVMIGHHVVFINDKYPRATNAKGELRLRDDWIPQKTLVMNGSSIGSNSTILGGITIGENSIIGAGSVVTKSIPSNVIAYGNPARVVRKISS
jgi:UDP-2-acetamido-3-amino-2,3-dideoxy-glucuronate N-acetyltransferase